MEENQDSSTHLLYEDSKNIHVDTGKLLDKLMEQFIPMITAGENPSQLGKKFDSILLKTFRQTSLKEDPFLLQSDYKEFKISDGRKGIYFPTQITRNQHIIRNKEEKEKKTIILPGDLIKFSASIHIDGFVCMNCVSFFVSSDSENPKILETKIDKSSQSLPEKINTNLTLSDEKKDLTEKISNNEKTKSFPETMSKEEIEVLNKKRENLMLCTKKIATEMINHFKNDITNLQFINFMKEALIEVNQNLSSFGPLNFVDGILLHSIKQYIPDSDTFIRCPSILLSLNASQKLEEKFSDEKEIEEFSLKEGMCFEVHLLCYYLNDYKNKIYKKMKNSKGKQGNEIVFSEGNIYCRNFDIIDPNIRVKCAQEAFKKIERKFGAFYFSEGEFAKDKRGIIGIKILEKNNILNKVDDAKMKFGLDCCEIRFVVGVGKEKGTIISGSFFMK